METIMLQGKTKAEMKIFIALAKRMGIKAKFLNADEMEEIALANAMEKGRTGKFIDKDQFLKNLTKE
ncbi:MAG: hypothetical protein ACOVLC_10730 [Flavobacterium sp.]